MLSSVIQADCPRRFHDSDIYKKKQFIFVSNSSLLQLPLSPCPLQQALSYPSSVISELKLVCLSPGIEVTQSQLCASFNLTQHLHLSPSYSSSTLMFHFYPFSSIPFPLPLHLLPSPFLPLIINHKTVKSFNSACYIFVAVVYV